MDTTIIPLQTKSLTLFVFIFIMILVIGCREEDGFDPYERPDWLEGKLYTQILEQPELSTFAECIKLTGYDTIINVSGSYTVFAPSNEAFEKWFTANPEYSSVEDIPISELNELVKYQIIQNPWSSAQLRSLDVFGWIDTLDVNNDEPRGFKRESLLKGPDRWVGYRLLRDNRAMIVDTTEVPRKRRIFTESRKFVPLFYPEYFNIYNLSSGDYEFYFDRPFDSGNMYVANAKIVKEEIFSENGFIHVTDEVVPPLRNAYQILANSKGDADIYSNYLDLVNLFPRFNYDEDATFDQEGAEQGTVVDSLFNVTYPELVFNINSERTQSPKGLFGLPSNVTIRYHHGLMAPTNEALDELINEHIKIPGGWGDLDGAPLNIKRIIANTHMSINPVYPTDFTNGFYNGEADIVTLNEDNIVHKEFGSNSTFIGLNKAIVPRAFSSVTRAVYLRQGYSKIMYAIEKANLLPLLKRKNKDYMFFVESDMNTSTDSSLVYNRTNDSFAAFQVAEDQGGGFTRFPLTVSDLRVLLLSHIAAKRPTGIPTKEFLPNLAGSYLIVNNETGEISGTSATTRGYGGSTPVPEFPRILSEADNGTAYNIQNWFSFSSPTLFSLISTRFPDFHALLRKAGFALDKEFRYTFISNSEFYTVFVPTKAAIDSAGLKTMPVEQLREKLLLHFVQGALIFTDGQQNPGYYETVREDETSTQYTTVFTKLYVEPGVDVINLRNNSGGVYTQVQVSGENTNILTGVLENTNAAFPTVFNNGVIHEIDKVLTLEELDTN